MIRRVDGEPPIGGSPFDYLICPIGVAPPAVDRPSADLMSGETTLGGS